MVIIVECFSKLNEPSAYRQALKKMQLNNQRMSNTYAANAGGLTMAIVSSKTLGTTINAWV